MDTTKILSRACLLILVTEARGQEVLHYVDSEAAGVNRFQIHSVGDHDGDGFDDFIVGCNCVGDGGMRLYSGLTGEIVWSKERTGHKVLEVASLDYNGDGTKDYLACMIFESGVASSSGRVAIYDGENAALLVEVSGYVASGWLGWNADTVGDLDGDGDEEFILSSRPFSEPVRIYRGGDAGIYRLHTSESSYASVAGMGDVDGDGLGDYVIGYGGAGGQAQGVVKLHSGADGSVIREWQGVAVGMHLGAWVANAGDVNADGVPDVVAGAPGSLNSVYTKTGYTRVFSGLDGSLLYHWDPYSVNRNFGTRVEGGGDVNGDGYDDVMVCSVRQSGEIYVYSGKTGSILWWKYGDGLTLATDSYLAILGDTNGDGLDDWAWVEGTIINDYGVQGRLYICSGADADAVVVCPGEVNSTGKAGALSLEGAVSLTDLSLSLIGTQLPSDQTGLFFYGTPSSGVPFGQGVLCAGAGPNTLWRLGPPGTVDSNGQLERAIDFDVPPVSTGSGAWLGGSEWTAQVWYRDPAAATGAFNLSSAVLMRFAP